MSYIVYKINDDGEASEPLGVVDDRDPTFEIYWRMFNEGTVLLIQNN